MGADCNANSRAKEVCHLIIVITSSLVWANIVVNPSVTAKVEVSRLVCGSTLLTEVVLPRYIYGNYSNGVGLRKRGRQVLVLYSQTPHRSWLWHQVLLPEITRPL